VAVAILQEVVGFESLLPPLLGCAAALLTPKTLSLKP
jgi:hypothetical protein